MTQYYKLIKESQAKYTLIDGIMRKQGGKQCSYYIEDDDFGEMESKFLKYVGLGRDFEGFPTGKYRDIDKVYELKDYAFELGPGIIWLIGKDYENKENKLIITYPNTKDPMPQLMRSVYEKLTEKDTGYKWFVDLYDKNFSFDTLEFDFNEETETLTLDIIFDPFNFITSEDLIEVQENLNKPKLDNINSKKNRIVFGAPGTGKSCRLEKDRRAFGENYERVTFHPNYSYSQFVGTYKPVPERDEKGNKTGKITYKYVPGPFMRTFVKASNSDEPYLLLIEEINRANVTAVFGDVFQLLDRKNGESEYPIESSEDIRNYLEEEKEKGNLKQDFDITKIKIPGNMYIWATMNSADQGVFPMDTAFKRRWDFEYIGIDDEDYKIQDIEFKVCESEEAEREEHSIKWNDLRRGINHVLSNDCKINEDKLLGPYFLSGDLIKTNKEMKKTENLKEDEESLVFNNEKFIEAFKSKVLMYLFEDAAKQQQHKQKLFKGCERSTYAKYSSICKAFDDVGEAIFGEDILSKDKK